jgi:hypothetical protein
MYALASLLLAGGQNTARMLVAIAASRASTVLTILRLANVPRTS